MTQKALNRPSTGRRYFRRLRENIKTYPWLYLMILPVVAYFIIFKYLPMGGAIIAFKNYRPARGIWGSRWVGLENFKEFLTGPYAGRTITNTIQISLLIILFESPAPIILAVLINELRGGLYKRTVQTVSYLPHFISLVVVCGIVKVFTRTDGLITDIVVFFGGRRTDILSDPRYYRTIYVCTHMWQGVGWGSILYLATLSNSDPQLYEAAKIDGANRFQCMWYITLPVLVPVFVVQLIMRVGNIMSTGPERTLLLYSPAVYDKADILSSFVYRYGLEQLNYSYGSAVDLFNSVINLILLTSSNKLADLLTSESLW